MLDSGKLAAGQMMSGGASGEASSAHAHLQPDMLIDAHAGSDVVVPVGFALTSADFIRLGPDLLLEAPDGATLLVRGYFSIEDAPSLLSAQGALIPGDLALKLAGPSAPGEFAAGQGGQAQQAIGRADTINGSVNVIHADGTKGVLHKGDPVFQGDILQTVKGANVGLVFMDGTTLALGSAGRLVLDQMVYDAEAHTGKSAFSIVQGSFSFVSGQIAKSAPDAATIRTPVATIGIRGTMVAGSYSPETGLTTTLLPEGEGSGEFSITTAAGTSTSNVSYGAINVMNFFSAPSGVVIVSQGQVANSFQEVLSAISNTNNSNAAAKNTADQILTQVFQDANAKAAGTVQDAFKGQQTTTSVDPKVADALQKAIIAAVADGKPVAAALLAGMAAAEVYKQTLAQTGDEAKALQEAEKATAKLGVLDKADLTGDGKTGDGKTVEDPKNNQTEAPVTAAPTLAPTEAPATEAPVTSAPSITVEVTVVVTALPVVTAEITSPPVTEPPVTESSHSYSGTAIDGYVQGGTVFLDTNGNSQLDAGEVYVTTAPDGTYTINLSASSGTLVIKGGTDSDSGLALVGVMKAPVGSSVITPLTSIIAAVMDANPGMNSATAASQVATMLGVADAAALLTYDPVANKGTGSELADLNTAMTKVIALIQNAVPLLTSAGGDPLAAAAALFDALAQHGSSSLDLSDVTSIAELINTAAEDTPGVDTGTVASGIDDVKNDISSANANTYVLTHGVNNALTAAVTGTDGTTYVLTGAGESGDSFIDGNSNTNDVLKLDATANTLTVENVSTIQLAYGAAGKTQELTLTNVNSVVGTAGNDIVKLVDSAGVNSVFGGAGEDTVDYSGVSGNVTFLLKTGVADGAPGGDVLVGVETVIGGSGAGDSVWASGASDASGLIDLATGTASVTYLSNTYAYSFSGFEKAVGGANSDTLIGNSGDNFLNGGNGDDSIYGGAGVDSVLGGDGDDLIVGGAGADSIDGGGGNDTLSYEGESNNFTINLTSGQTKAASISTEYFANIENAIGGSGNDTITGTTGDNTLVGGAGCDTIYGGDGNDLIVGGLGEDSFDGGGGNDTVSYAGYYNGLTIDFLNNTVDDGTGADHIANFENAVGTDCDDRFIGDSGDNSFTGGAGDDRVDYSADASGVTFSMFLGTVSGTGVGADHLYTIETIIGGTAVDTITAAGGNMAVSINLTAGVADAGPYSYFLSDFENIVGTGYADSLTGDSGANIIEGGQGADELAGGGGGDSILGEDGDDAIYGGAGDDSLSGGVGSDLIYGDDGADKIEGGAGCDAIYGGAGDDSIKGEDGDDTIYGGAGSDNIDGGDGNDTLSYEGENKNFFIDMGNGLTTAASLSPEYFTNIENVIGGAGNDVILGNAANNTLAGGAGDDVLTGGGGDDVFSFNQATDSGDKTITDFEFGDRVRMADDAVTSVSNGSAGSVLAHGVNVHYDEASGDTYLYFNMSDSTGAANYTVTLDGVNMSASSFKLSDGDLVNVDASRYFLNSASANALVFNGTSDYVTLSGGTMFSGADSFSIAMWVNVTGDGKLYTQRGWDNKLGISTYVGSNGSIQFGLDKFTTGGWETFTTAAGALNFNIWTHLTFVKDGDSYSLYVNGELYTGAMTERVNDVDTVIPDGNSGSFEINATQLSAEQGNAGAYFAGDWDLDGFAGKFGELAVFSTALSGSEVQSIFETTPTTSTAGIVELYTLESGDLLNDAKSNHDIVLTSYSGGATGTAGDDTFNIALPGSYVGLAGSDTYALGDLPGSGKTVVIDDSAGAADTLKFNMLDDYSVNHAVAGFYRDGDDLVISLTQNWTGSTYDGGLVVVDDQYAGTGKGVEYLTDGGDGTPIYVATTSMGGGATLVGTTASDLLVGGAGQTVLTGGAGGDMFYGLAGQTWIGGAGKDEASFWDASGGVSVLLNESGNGTAVWTNGSSYTVWLQGIEELEGGEHNDFLIGNSQSNWFEGRDGNDTIDGGQGQDTISYASHATTDNATGITVNLSGSVDANGYYSVTHGGFVDLVRNIENIEGSDYNDAITGAAGKDNWISGGKGCDVLSGDNGDGFDHDTVAYDEDPGGVTVNLGTTQYVYNSVTIAANTAIDGWGNTDTVTNFEGVRGSDYDDLLIGATATTILIGATTILIGATTFAPGKGSDVVIGRFGSDTVAYWDDSDPSDTDYPSQGISLVLDSLGTVTLTDPWNSGDTDTLIGIAHVQGTSRDDELSGAGANDTSVSNTLEGRGGSDALIGDANYNDVATYYSAESGITANLSTNTVSDGLGGADTLTYIRKIQGSNYDDTLFIGSGDDTFWGGGGDDVVIVNDFAKLAANDVLAGGDNDPASVSGQGDVLKLNDSSHATVSLDFTTGATVSGFEKIELAQDVSYTLVLDDGMVDSADYDGYSGSADHKLAISASTTLTKKVVINASDLDDGQTTYVNAANFTGNNTFIGGDSDDSYVGGAGNDVFRASLGHDSFVGGSGANAIYFNTVSGAIVCNLDVGTASYASHAEASLAFSGASSVFTGSSNDFIIGSTASETIYTAEGDDVIALLGTLTAGDAVYGGLGNDTVNFDGDLDDYVLDFSSGLTLDVIHGGVTTHLEDVENLTFADGSSIALFGGQVNSHFSNDQHYSKLATLSDGKHVAIWSSEGQAAGSGSDQGFIFMQIYNADGSKFGDELQVSSTDPASAGNQVWSDVAAYSGGYVVVWSSYDSGWTSHFQRFNNAGETRGSETVIGTDANNVDVTASTSGSTFVATWQETTDLKAAFFNAADGAQVGTTIDVGAGEDMHVAATASGGFVASWELGGDVYFRIFDASGTTLTSSAMVNQTTAGNQIGSDVAALGNGNIVVTWQSGTAGAYDIYARVFDSSGDEVRSEVLVNSSGTAGDQNLADVTALVGSTVNANGFVVCWADDQTGVVYAKMYTSAGVAFGSTITVSGDGLGGASFPSITALANGGFAVSWNGYDASGDGVFTQSFDQYGQAVESTVGNVIQANNGDNVIDADGSVDVIYGNGGDDTLSGAPTLLGGDGNDTLISGEGDEYLDGGLLGDNTVSYAEAVDGVTVELNFECTSSGGGGTDTITNVTAIIGSDYDDEFTGNSDTHETFYGGGGDDILIAVGTFNSLFGGDGCDALQASGVNLLEGGAGNDLFIVGNNVTIGDFAYGDTIEFDGLSLSSVGLGNGATIDPYGAAYLSANGDTTIYFNTDDSSGSADSSIILEGLELSNTTCELSVSGDKLVLNANVVAVPSVTGEDGYVVALNDGLADRVYTESGDSQTIHLNDLAQSGDSIYDGVSGDDDALELAAGANTLSISGIETVILSSDADNTIELASGSSGGSATFVGGGGDDVYYLFSDDTSSHDTSDAISVAAGSGTDTIHAFSLNDRLKLGTPIFSITNGTGATAGYGEIQVSWTANATTLHIGADTTAGSDYDVVLIGSITDFDDDVYETTGYYAAANFTTDADGNIMLISGVNNVGLTGTADGELISNSLTSNKDAFGFASGGAYSTTLDLSGNAGLGDAVNMGDGAADMLKLLDSGSQIVSIEGVEKVMGATDMSDAIVFTGVKGDSLNGDVTVYLGDGQNSLTVDANRVKLNNGDLAQGAIDFSVVGGSGTDTVNIVNSNAASVVTISMSTMTNVDVLNLSGSQGVYLLAGNMIDLSTITGSAGNDTIYNGAASSDNWSDIKDDVVSGIENMDGVIVYASQLDDVETLGNAEIRKESDSDDMDAVSLRANASVKVRGEFSLLAEEVDFAEGVTLGLAEKAKLYNDGIFNINGADVTISMVSNDEHFYNAGGTLALDAGADLTLATSGTTISTAYLDGHISLGVGAKIYADFIHLDVDNTLFVEGDYGTSLNLDSSSTFDADGATLDLSGVTNATLGETFSLVHADEAGDITNGFSALEGLDLGGGNYFHVSQNTQDISATVLHDDSSTAGDDVYGFVGDDEIHAAQAGDDVFRFASASVSGATLLGGLGNDTLYVADTDNLDTLCNNMFDGGGGSGVDKIVFDASINDAFLSHEGVNIVGNSFYDNVTGVEELDFAAGTTGHYMRLSAEELFGLESDATLGGYTNVIIGGADGNTVSLVDAVNWLQSSSITNAGYTVYEHVDGRGDTDMVMSVADGISVVSDIGGAIITR